jgi:hypothetical protein
MKAKQLCVIIRAKTLLLSKEKAAASVHNFGAPGMIKAGLPAKSFLQQNKRYGLFNFTHFNRQPHFYGYHQPSG